MTVRAVIKGACQYLPTRVVEKAELEATLNTTDEWIKSRSGIVRRHFATEGHHVLNGMRCGHGRTERCGDGRG